MSLPDLSSENVPVTDEDCTIARSLVLLLEDIVLVLGACAFASGDWRSWAARRGPRAGQRSARRARPAPARSTKPGARRALYRPRDSFAASEQRSRLAAQAFASRNWRATRPMRLARISATCRPAPTRSTKPGARHTRYRPTPRRSSRALGNADTHEGTASTPSGETRDRIGGTGTRAARRRRMHARSTRRRTLRRARTRTRGSRASQRSRTVRVGSLAGSPAGSTSRDQSLVFHAGTGVSHPAAGTNADDSTRW